MTSEKADPPFRTPQDKLASRSWRMLNSWWILVPLLSLGMLAWLGFFVAGLQIRRAKYWLSAAIYTVLMIATFIVVDDQNGLRGTLFTVCLLLCWLGATVQSIVMNRRYLIELAHRRSWYATHSPMAQPPVMTATPGWGQPASVYYGPPPQGPVAGQSGSWSPAGQGAQNAAPPAPPWTRPAEPGTQASWSRPLDRPIGVDVNQASLHELAAVGPVGPELAQRIVATRQARGPFRDLDDLAFTLGLQPHELVRLASISSSGRRVRGLSPDEAGCSISEGRQPVSGHSQAVNTDSKASGRAIRVARVIPATQAEGPGRRFAVWVQGCSIGCQGCFNPQLWDAVGGEALTPAELFDHLDPEAVEGVTLLGGEPFEQADQMADFAELVQAAGLTVMTFTGYTLGRLNSRAIADPGTQRLLSATDLLVDGPYQPARPDRVRPWVGSTNQRFHFLTDRYQDLSDRLEQQGDRIEVRVHPDGTTTLNGWAETHQLEALLAELPLVRQDGFLAIGTSDRYDLDRDAALPEERL